MKRSKHTLSHYRMLTGGMGQLLPVNLTEVLPGDTIQAYTNAVIRMAPLNTPVMHPVTVRLHHFFVPHRLVWADFPDFITGKDDTLEIPTTIPLGGRDSLPHYFGIPPATNIAVNALPIMAYNLIYNEYYRDQDLIDEVPLTQPTIKRVAWEKDYFTTARPWTQKGGDITIPIGDRAPVRGIGHVGTLYPLDENVTEYDSEAVNDTRYANAANFDTSVFHDSWTNENGVTAPNIYADLSQASAIDVGDVRTAFALQRYNEARARYGSRYTEYLRYNGIRPSDARLDRPELLGGGTTQINFSEVLQTAPEQGGEPSSRASVGDMYGHGIAGMRGNKFRKFFDEHGYFMTLMSVRPKAIYQDGIERTFLRKTKEDFFQKELAHIGQEEITLAEIQAKAADPSEVFGYQDRYRSYREQRSHVIGEFQDTLNMWHLGRSLPTDVTLNDDFVNCVPSNRIFQIDDNQHLWCMVNNHIVARRMVPKNAKAKVL